jgi:hypothetical protein
MSTTTAKLSSKNLILIKKDSPTLSKMDIFEKCTHLKNATFENKTILKSARLENN